MFTSKLVPPWNPRLHGRLFQQPSLWMSVSWIRRGGQLIIRKFFKSSCFLQSVAQGQMQDKGDCIGSATFCPQNSLIFNSAEQFGNFWDIFVMSFCHWGQMWWHTYSGRALWWDLFAPNSGPLWIKLVGVKGSNPKGNRKRKCVQCLFSNENLKWAINRDC